MNGIETLQQVAAPLAVIALAAVLWWLRRKGLAHPASGRQTARGGRRLEAVERLALAPQHTLHLVRVVDRLVLIAQSPSGLSLLDSRAFEAGLAEPASIPAPGQEVVK